MREETRGGFLLKLAGAAAILLVSAVQLGAQASYPAPNAGDNPYKTGTIFGSFPDGRKWGSTSGVAIGPDGIARFSAPVREQKRPVHASRLAGDGVSHQCEHGGPEFGPVD